MDYLREGIHLRGFAQIDPLVAYKNEGFELFRDLMNTIWSDFARMIFHVEVEIEGEEPPAPHQYVPGAGSSSTTAGAQVSYSSGVTAGAGAIAAAAAGAEASGYAEAGLENGAGNGAPVAVQQRRTDEHETLGRNDPCWCGSGKKFKKCHGA
jgi:preprotein translocase subunit SecA